MPLSILKNARARANRILNKLEEEERKSMAPRAPQAPQAPVPGMPMDIADQLRSMAQTKDEPIIPDYSQVKKTETPKPDPKYQTTVTKGIGETTTPAPPPVTAPHGTMARIIEEKRLQDYQQQLRQSKKEQAQPVSPALEQRQPQPVQQPRTRREYQQQERRPITDRVQVEPTQTAESVMVEHEHGIYRDVRPDTDTGPGGRPVWDRAGLEYKPPELPDTEAVRATDAMGIGEFTLKTLHDLSARGLWAFNQGVYNSLEYLAKSLERPGGPVAVPYIEAANHIYRAVTGKDEDYVKRMYKTPTPIMRWLDERIEKYSNPQDHVPVIPEMALQRQRIRDINYADSFTMGVAGDMAELGTEVLWMMIQMALLNKLSAYAITSQVGMIAPGTTSAATQATNVVNPQGWARAAYNRVSRGIKMSQHITPAEAQQTYQRLINGMVHAGVTTPGDLEDRMRAAVMRGAYMVTPVVANASGLTGLPAAGLDVLMNSALTSPMYIEAYEEAGGFTQEFWAFAIPQFAMDLFMARTTRGLMDIQRQDAINTQAKRLSSQTGVPERYFVDAANRGESMITSLLKFMDDERGAIGRDKPQVEWVNRHDMYRQQKMDGLVDGVIAYEVRQEKGKWIGENRRTGAKTKPFDDPLDAQKKIISLDKPKEIGKADVPKTEQESKKIISKLTSEAQRVEQKPSKDRVVARDELKVKDEVRINFAKMDRRMLKKEYGHLVDFTEYGRSKADKERLQADVLVARLAENRGFEPERAEAPATDVRTPVEKPAETPREERVAEREVKEPWQMTREEYVKASDRDIYKPGDTHKSRVLIALSEGKTVPSEVLKDYPDLQGKVEPELKITPADETKAPTKTTPAPTPEKPAEAISAPSTAKPEAVVATKPLPTIDERIQPVTRTETEVRPDTGEPRPLVDWAKVDVNEFKGVVSRASTDQINELITKIGHNKGIIGEKKVDGMLKAIENELANRSKERYEFHNPKLTLAENENIARDVDKLNKYVDNNRSYLGEYTVAENKDVHVRDYYRGVENIETLPQRTITKMAEDFARKKNIVDSEGKIDIAQAETMLRHRSAGMSEDMIAAVKKAAEQGREKLTYDETINLINAHRHYTYNERSEANQVYRNDRQSIITNASAVYGGKVDPEQIRQNVDNVMKIVTEDDLVNYMERRGLPDIDTAREAYRNDVEAAAIQNAKDAPLPRYLKRLWNRTGGAFGLKNFTLDRLAMDIEGKLWTVEKMVAGETAPAMYRYTMDALQKAFAVGYQLRQNIDTSISNLTDSIGQKAIMKHSEAFTANRNHVDRHEFTLEVGRVSKGVKTDVRSVELTVGEMMYVYLLGKSVDGKHVAALGDIDRGGIRLSDQKNPTDWAKRTNHKESHRYIITENDYNNIVRHLSEKYPDAVRMADHIFELFNGPLKDHVNAETLRSLGYEAALIDMYLPIYRSKYDIRGADPADMINMYQSLPTADYGLNHRYTYDSLGLLQSRTADVAPFLIRDLYVSVGRYTEAAAQLRMLEVQRDYERVVNSKDFKIAMNRIGADAIAEQIDRNMKTIITFGGKNINDIDRMAGDLLTKFQQAKLGFNPSVIAIQPISVLYALTQLPKEYLASAVKHPIPVHFDREVLNEIMQYSPVHGYARFMMGQMSRAVGEVHDVGKLRQAYMGRTALGQKLTAGIRAADKWVMGNIWHMAKDYVANTRPELSGEEQMRLTGQTYDMIVNRTQPTFLPHTRSEITMNQNPFMRSLVLFYSQRNKIFNEMSHLIKDFQRSDKPLKERGVDLISNLSLYLLGAALVATRDELRDWVFGRPSRGIRGGKIRAIQTLIGTLPVVGDMVNASLDLMERDEEHYRGLDNPLLGTIENMIVAGNYIRIASGQAYDELLGRTEEEDAGEWHKTLLRGMPVAFEIADVLTGLPAMNIYNYTRAGVRKVSPEAQFMVDNLGREPHSGREYAKAWDFLGAANRGDTKWHFQQERFFERQMEILVNHMEIEWPALAKSINSRIEAGTLTEADYDKAREVYDEIIERSNLTVGPTYAMDAARAYELEYDGWKKDFEEIVDRAEIDEVELSTVAYYGDARDALEKQDKKAFEKAVEALRLMGKEDDGIGKTLTSSLINDRAAYRLASSLGIYPSYEQVMRDAYERNDWTAFEEALDKQSKILQQRIKELPVQASEPTLTLASYYEDLAEALESNNKQAVEKAEKALEMMGRDKDDMVSAMRGKRVENEAFGYVILHRELMRDALDTNLKHDEPFNVDEFLDELDLALQKENQTAGQMRGPYYTRLEKYWGVDDAKVENILTVLKILGVTRSRLRGIKWFEGLPGDEQEKLMELWDGAEGSPAPTPTRTTPTSPASGTTTTKKVTQPVAQQSEFVPVAPARPGTMEHIMQIHGKGQYAPRAEFAPRASEQARAPRGLFDYEPDRYANLPNLARAMQELSQRPIYKNFLGTISVSGPIATSLREQWAGPRSLDHISKALDRIRTGGVFS